jgi:hypothetical protein
VSIDHHTEILLFWKDTGARTAYDVD